MKNGIKQYHKIKKKRFPVVRDKKLAKDLSRADDDGFAGAENNLGASSMDQASDCWSNLWQRIKAQASRFFRRKK